MRPPEVALGEIAVPVTRIANDRMALPVYSISKHDGFVRSDEYFKKQVHSSDTSSYKVVQPGDFAFSPIHLDEGSIALSTQPGLISPMYKVFEVDRSRCDAEYLIRALKSPKLLRTYGTLGDGSVHRRRSVSYDRLSEVRLPLPSLTEQRRIAAILDKADALRRKRKRALDLLDGLTQSIFLEMFGDPLENPKSFKTFSFDSLLEVPPNFGSMIPPQKEVLGWVSLRVANIQNWALTLSDTKYIDLADGDIGRHTLCDGDIVLARAIASEEHLGKCVVVEPAGQKWAFDSHLMRIRLKANKIAPVYVSELFRTPGGRRIFLKSARKTTVQYNINTKEVRALRIPVPPIELQREYLSRIQALRSIKMLCERSLLDIEVAFSSLQHRAFTGQL